MTSERPSGTVTFLFTDIEGSTQLWENHPEWMARAHTRQEELLRAAFEKHGGYPYKMIGDAFQVAFASAPAAVAAAIDAQRALQAEPWGESEIRVRMAIHSGETDERDDDYVGPLLNRVARLMSAGHGGQVLISQSTCELVRDRLPATIRLRDLGERRLRDLNRPERVHLLLVPGLRQDFPPLKTLDAHPNNLPVQLTHFIGREQPIAELAQILARSRLVTLTGSGGSGKTRLALQLGGELLDRFEHGVWFVELAPLTDEHEVPQAVATALGVEEAAERPVIEALLARVTGEERLVILDNCEHLMSASIQLVTALLRASPRSRVLATSREPLRVAGEATYRVPSLAIPDPNEGATLATLASSEAVRLFADRAVNVTSSFVLTDASVPIVAEICRRLDGIPLAIELAAARVVSLSVERLAERLSDRFRLLARGDRAALPRQQTLRALIDWSHELLTEPERVLLRRLAVFAGSFALDAAETVCAGGEVDELDVLDLLTNLVEKSLVAIEPGSERFRLLETIREYAYERLQAANEEIEVRDRHLAHYLTRAEQASETIRSGETAKWKALEIDHENFMAAHAWCDQRAGHAEAGLRLMLALRDYWYARGMLEPGLRVGLQAISRPGAEARTLHRCRALHEIARLKSWLFQGRDSEGLATESLEIARELGANDRAAMALRQLGLLAQYRNDEQTALARVQEAISLARGLADTLPLTTALSTLAEIQRTRGDLEAAEPLYEESLAIGRKLGDRLSVSLDLLNLAAIHVDRRYLARAVAPLREGLTTVAEASLKAIGQYGLDVSAALAAARQEWSLAARVYGASEAYRIQIGISRDPVDVKFVARHVAQAREALGEDAYVAAEAAGRGLRYEEVLAEARRWLEGLESGARI
ncbi:MAG: adenylate/guanylate cyclase domain-containing protein [bacterium]